MNGTLVRGARSLALLGALLASPGLYAGTANVVGSDGSAVTFEYSADKLRVTVGEETAGYMVFRDDHMYMVTQQDGQTIVIDANQALSMFGSMAQAAAPDMVVTEMIALDATGRQEQLAGISGEVYNLRYRTEDGKEHQAEVVLSDDPRAKEFRDSVYRFASSMAKTVGKEYDEASGDMQARLTALDKGVLRYGTDMKVTALSAAAVDESRFVLPAEPMDLSAIGAIFGGGQAGQGGQSGGVISGMLGSLKRAGQPAEGEDAKAGGEGEGAGTPAEELGKAFGKLFGK